MPEYQRRGHARASGRQAGRRDEALHPELCACGGRQDEDMGLSAEPAVSPVVALEPGAHAGLAIIASDGLWDVTDQTTVVNTALRVLPQGLRAATEALLQLAQRQRTRDDVTIMLLHISP